MTPDLPSADELFDVSPSAAPQDIQDAAYASMGLADSPARPRPPLHPGIHELAEDLGLA